MHTPVLKRSTSHVRGVQKIYRFENGYGASVVKSGFSYGGDVDLWELAVVLFNNEKDDLDFDLVYDTSVTDDVLGHLNEADVERLLKAVEALPKRA